MIRIDEQCAELIVERSKSQAECGTQTVSILAWSDCFPSACSAHGVCFFAQQLFFEPQRLIFASVIFQKLYVVCLQLHHLWIFRAEELSLGFDCFFVKAFCFVFLAPIVIEQRDVLHNSRRLDAYSASQAGVDLYESF